MTLVGIIPNPASGKDIRRVTSHAIAANNHQKSNIVRRVLLALGASGVERIEIMPDSFGVGQRALGGLESHHDIQAVTSHIPIPVEGNQQDTLRAAQYLRDAGAGCIIVLGGDGTCRVASKGCGEVPLLPISTGTNNVVPYFIEGTAAGLAAAYVAGHPELEREHFCYRHKRLLVWVNGEQVDQALVDVALLATRFTGSKAVWEAGELRQVFVSRAQPFNIGISSVVGVVRPIRPIDPGGACVSISTDGHQVMAPIAPGSFAPVGIRELRDMQPGIPYPVRHTRPAVLSLDGEREITLSGSDQAEVSLDLQGPWIVDVEQALLLAVEAGTFEINHRLEDV